MKFILTLILIGLFNFSAFTQKWQPLFNGKDLSGWIPKIHHYETGDNYAHTFRVEDGMIQVRYDEYDFFKDKYGHLFYQTPFSNYKLRFEYRFVGKWLEGDAPSYTQLNSGIMFHSQDPYTILKEQDWPISVEYQMLVQTKEGEVRPTANMCSPGTDVFYEGKKDPRHCINSSSPTFMKGEWIQGELEVHGDRLVIHYVNGKEVLRYTKPQIGGGVANGFDTNLKIDGTPLSSGYIGLQSEGQEIDFRNIEIMILEN